VINTVYTRGGENSCSTLLTARKYIAGIKEEREREREREREETK